MCESKTSQWRRSDRRTAKQQEIHGPLVLVSARRLRLIPYPNTHDSHVLDTKGNSYNDEERWVAAGYENGDVKLFDLRAMALRWETNLKNGVIKLARIIPASILIGENAKICAIEFDRKDIRANKMVVTTLESSFHVFDLRTRHPKNGFASTVEKVCLSRTCVYPLSQNH